jgi:hypothetical protein
LSELYHRDGESIDPNAPNFPVYKVEIDDHMEIPALPSPLLKILNENADGQGLPFTALSFVKKTESQCAAQKCFLDFKEGRFLEGFKS